MLSVAFVWVPAVDALPEFTILWFRGFVNVYFLIFLQQLSPAPDLQTLLTVPYISVENLDFLCLDGIWRPLHLDVNYGLSWCLNLHLDRSDLSRGPMCPTGLICTLALRLFSPVLFPPAASLAETTKLCVHRGLLAFAHFTCCERPFSEVFYLRVQIGVCGFSSSVCFLSSACWLSPVP